MRLAHQAQMIETPPRVSTAAPCWIVAVAIGFAIALTFCVQGYQFGHSNHTVYLLDALHRLHPELLANDWFTTQTFQYHALFGLLTRGLMKLNVLAPAFFVGYLGLVILLHIACWRLVRVLGGGVGVFVVSEVLFHLLAAGTALGMYQFLQDSAFLPSNISAVALLWGIVKWLERRPIGAGAWFGVAAAFHLNFAPVVPMLWLVLYASQLRPASRAMLIGSALALLPAAINISFALRQVVPRSAAMPLAEFVDLYARLRHPHHYDPASWPTWMWLTFLIPIPPAVWVWIVRHREGADWAWMQAGRIFLLFALIEIAALIFAGVTLVSESLIQASLFRFSVYLKLLSCVGVAFMVERSGARRPVALAAVTSGFLMMAACLHRGPYLGLLKLQGDEESYLRACDWVRDNTPIDAVFIVPPNEQEFRVRAQRAIVVNFKGVPQLSAELITWRQRLQDVLDMPELRGLPRGAFPAALEAIRDRYDDLPPAHLIDVAAKYHARYVLTGRRWPEQYEPLRLDLDGNRSWFLYDLSRPREGTSDGNR